MKYFKCFEIVLLQILRFIAWRGIERSSLLAGVPRDLDQPKWRIHVNKPAWPYVLLFWEPWSDRR